MARVDGVPVRKAIPSAWARGASRRTAWRSKQLIDALVEIHAVDWKRCGLTDFAHTEQYLSRQVDALARAAGLLRRPRPSRGAAHRRLARRRGVPPTNRPTLAHGDYKLDNVLFAPDAPPRLLAVVDWEMASIGDPLVDLAWALIFHPGPGGTMPLGMAGEPRFALDHLPAVRGARSIATPNARAATSPIIGWYEVFSRWKLAIVLEGSYAKFVRGQSDKPVHEFFGPQADLLLAGASDLIERGDA